MWSEPNVNQPQRAFQRARDQLIGFARFGRAGRVVVGKIAARALF